MSQSPWCIGEGQQPGTTQDTVEIRGYPELSAVIQATRRKSSVEDVSFSFAQLWSKWSWLFMSSWSKEAILAVVPEGVGIKQGRFMWEEKREQKASNIFQE